MHVGHGERCGVDHGNRCVDVDTIGVSTTHRYGVAGCMCVGIDVTVCTTAKPNTPMSDLVFAHP